MTTSSFNRKESSWLRILFVLVALLATYKCVRGATTLTEPDPFDTFQRVGIDLRAPGLTTDIWIQQRDTPTTFKSRVITGTAHIGDSLAIDPDGWLVALPMQHRGANIFMDPGTLIGWGESYIMGDDATGTITIFTNEQARILIDAEGNVTVDGNTTLIGDTVVEGSLTVNGVPITGLGTGTGITDGDYGDIAVSAGGTFWQVKPGLDGSRIGPGIDAGNITTGLYNDITLAGTSNILWDGSGTRITDVDGSLSLNAGVGLLLDGGISGVWIDADPASGVNISSGLTVAGVLDVIGDITDVSLSDNVSLLGQTIESAEIISLEASKVTGDFANISLGETGTVSWGTDFIGGSGGGMTFYTEGVPRFTVNSAGDIVLANETKFAWSSGSYLANATNGNLSIISPNVLELYGDYGVGIGAGDGFAVQFESETNFLLGDINLDEMANLPQGYIIGRADNPVDGLSPPQPIEVMATDFTMSGRKLSLQPIPLSLSADFTKLGPTIESGEIAGVDADKITGFYSFIPMTEDGIISWGEDYITGLGGGINFYINEAPAVSIDTAANLVLSGDTDIMWSGGTTITDNGGVLDINAPIALEMRGEYGIYFSTGGIEGFDQIAFNSPTSMVSGDVLLDEMADIAQGFIIGRSDNPVAGASPPQPIQVMASDFTMAGAKLSLQPFPGSLHSDYSRLGQTITSSEIESIDATKVLGVFPYIDLEEGGGIYFGNEQTYIAGTAGAISLYTNDVARITLDTSGDLLLSPNTDLLWSDGMSIEDVGGAMQVTATNGLTLDGGGAINLLTPTEFASTVSFDDVTFHLGGGAPTTVPPNNLAFYTKGDGLFYSKNPAGLEAVFLTGTGGSGPLTDGNKGDITVSGSGAVFTINPSTVTLPKMADLAQGYILGRSDNPNPTSPPQPIRVNSLDFGMSGSVLVLQPVPDGLDPQIKDWSDGVFTSAVEIASGFPQLTLRRNAGNFATIGMGDFGVVTLDATGEFAPEFEFLDPVFFIEPAYLYGGAQVSGTTTTDSLVVTTDVALPAGAISLSEMANLAQGYILGRSDNPVAGASPPQPIRVNSLDFGMSGSVLVLQPIPDGLHPNLKAVGNIPLDQNRFWARLAAGAGPPDASIMIGPQFSLAGSPPTLSLSTNYQTANVHLTDLSDGTLTGSKVGDGINASNITTGVHPRETLPVITTFLGDTIDDAEITGIAASKVTGIMPKESLPSSIAYKDSNNFFAQHQRVEAGWQWKARYAANDAHHGSFDWASLQLGNNGTNYIVGGRTVAGGELAFFVNNTNNVTGSVAPDGIEALRLLGSGNARFGGTLDVVAPAPQLTMRVNAGNLVTMGVNAAGSVTFDAVSDTGTPSFTFKDPVNFEGLTTLPAESVYGAAIADGAVTLPKLAPLASGYIMGRASTPPDPGPVEAIRVASGDFGMSGSVLVLQQIPTSLDPDLKDLADGSLTGSKVGDGINASNITTGVHPPETLPAATSFLGPSISNDEITGVAASKITGTIPVETLPTNIAYKDVNNVFTGIPNTFNGGIVVAGAVTLPAGSIDGTEIADGTITGADLAGGALGGVAMLAGNQTFTGSNIFSQSVSINNMLRLETTGNMSIFGYGGNQQASMIIQRLDNSAYITHDGTATKIVAGYGPRLTIQPGNAYFNDNLSVGGALTVGGAVNLPAGSINYLELDPSILPYHSGSDFVDGTLVETNIPAAASDGASFVIEISGKSYSPTNPPFKVIAQGYLYGGTIVSASGLSYGGTFAPYIKMLEQGGVLKFWWPRITYWNSFSVHVRDAQGSSGNTVTSIINATEPAATKKVQVDLQYGLNSSSAIPAANITGTVPQAALPNTIAYQPGANVFTGVNSFSNVTGMGSSAVGGYTLTVGNNTPGGVGVRVSTGATSGNSWGVLATADGVGATSNIAGSFSASGGASNFAIQTGTGKVLFGDITEIATAAAPQLTLRRDSGNLMTFGMGAGGSALIDVIGETSPSLNIRGGNVGLGIANASTKLSMKQTVDTQAGGISMINAAGTEAGYIWNDAVSNLHLDAASTKAAEIRLNYGGAGPVRTGGALHVGNILRVEGTGTISLAGYGGDATRSLILQRTDSSANIYHDGTSTRFRVGVADRFILSPGSAQFDVPLNLLGPTTYIGSSLYRYQNLATFDYRGAQTGTKKITMPFTWNDNMGTTIIRGYDYSNSGSWEVIVSGYSYSAGYWINTAVEINGKAPFSKVRVAHDGTKCCILLGDTSTYWGYPHIEITDFYSTFSNLAGHGSGWTIANITSEAGVTGAVNLVAPIYSDAAGLTTVTGVGGLKVAYDDNNHGVMQVGSTGRLSIEPTGSGAAVDITPYFTVGRTTGMASWGNIGNHSGLLSWDAGKAIITTVTGNSLNIGTGGRNSSIMVNAANDNVGIGGVFTAANLTGKLNLYSSSPSNQILNFNSAGSEQDFAMGISNSRPGYLDLTFNSEYGEGAWTERMRLNKETGYLGIGTTPGAKLDVRGTGGANLMVDWAGGGTNYYDAGTHYFRDTAGNQKLTLTGNSMTLGNGTAETDLVITGGSSSYSNATLTLQANSGPNQRGLGTYYFDVAGQNAWFAGRPYSNSDQFVIKRRGSMPFLGSDTADPAVGTTFLNILGNGNTLIGSRDDFTSAKLQVTTSSGPQQAWFFDAGSNYATLAVGSTGIASFNAQGGSQSFTFQDPVYIQHGNWFSPDTNAYSRLWTPNQPIGNVSWAGQYGHNLTYNAKYSGGWKGIAGGNATNLSIGEGRLAFTTAYSSATDAALAWSDKFIIEADGKVGIGPGSVTGSPSEARLNIIQDTTATATEGNFGLKISDGTSDVALTFAVDSVGNKSVIQSMDPGTTWATRDLHLQPNGGKVVIGPEGIQMDTLNLGRLGAANGVLNSPEALYFNIDSTNVHADTQRFEWAKNRASNTSGTVLMSLLESGALNVQGPIYANTGQVMMGGYGSDPQKSIIYQAADSRAYIYHDSVTTRFFAGNAERFSIGPSLIYSQANFMHSGVSTYNGGSITHYKHLANFRYNGTPQLGIKKITMPFAGPNIMGTYVIRGYDYSGSGGWEVVLSGYSYSSEHWTNTSCEIRGKAPFSTVRVAHDSIANKAVILLGLINTVWEYPQIEVTDFFAGYSNTAGWENGWGISNVTAETGFINIAQVVAPIYTTPAGHTSIAGNLGVGTTTPARNLTIDNASEPQLGFYTSGTERAVVRAATDGHLRFDLGGSEKMRIQANGRVVIGTAGGGGSAQLETYGVAGSWSNYVYNGAAPGSSYGLLIDAGRNAGDYAMYVRDGLSSAGLFFVRGDGKTAIGGSMNFIEKLDVDGVIHAGSGSTQGGLIMAGRYGGQNSYINTFSSLYSSAGTVVGYGVHGKNGSGPTYASSTSAGLARGAINVDNVGFHVVAAPLQTTAFDSPVTMTEQFTVHNASGHVTVGNSSDYGTGKLQVTNTAGPQALLVYNGSNYASMQVGSSGAVTMNATGSGELWSFLESVSVGGSLYTTGISNPSTSANAFIGMNSGGTAVTRNVADGNAAFQVIQGHASATGSIMRFSNNTGVVADVSQAGEFRIGGNASNINHLSINGAAGTDRVIMSETNGSRRWEMKLGDATNESGLNFGSQFALLARDDSGVVIDTPIRIPRTANYDMTFGRPANFSGKIKVGIGNPAYIQNPTGPIFGQYTSTIGYVQAPAGGELQIWDDNTSTMASFKDNGRFVVGGGGVDQGVAISTVTGTTTQEALVYSSGNYMTTTVGSTGLTTYDAFGGGAQFQFNDSVRNTSVVSVGSAVSPDNARLINAYGNTTTSADQYGAVIIPNASTAATNSMNGIYTQIYSAAGTRTTSTAQAVYVNSPSLGSGNSVTSNSGVRVANQGAAGIANAYGVLIEAQSNASTTNIGLLNQGTTQLGSTGTPFTGIRSATGSVDFVSMNAGIEDTRTVTVSGITSTNTPSVALGWIAPLPSGVVIKQAWVSGDNTVSITVLNTTTGLVNPNPLTVRATVTSF